VGWAPSDLNGVSGRSLRSVAMCFLACIPYIWPGPGSSEAMRLMTAWASVKIVTLSGVVLSPCSCFPGTGSTLHVIGFLGVAHVDFDAHPVLTALPYNRRGGGGGRLVLFDAEDANVGGGISRHVTTTNGI
jgi:hypothetical protein